MGEQLREGDIAFIGLREFWPELGDVPLQLNVVLLENMKQARAPQTLRGRPKQDNRVGCPGLLSLRISKAALQFENRFPFLPNGYCRAEFPEALEVLFEE